MGNTIKRARTDLGLTQVNVAEQISIDSRTIINIENYNGNPKMEILFPLIRALKIDPWDIFYPETKNESAAFRQMQILLKECSEEELEALLSVCQALLNVLRTKNSISISDDT